LERQKFEQAATVARGDFKKKGGVEVEKEEL
jgi:hypothetical protein